MSQVAYSATVRPVCLPATPERSYEGEEAVATGWGKLGTGGFPQQLMEVTLSTHYLHSIPTHCVGQGGGHLQPGVQGHLARGPGVS